jgi:hypothetical protein
VERRTPLTAHDVDRKKNMKKQLWFCLVYGCIGTLLGNGILAFFQGFHSHLPLSHMVIFMLFVTFIFYFIGSKTKTTCSISALTSTVWIAFTSAVIVFGELSDYIRFHNYIGYPNLSDAKYCLKYFLLYWPSVYVLGCLVVSPIFYLTTLAYKNVEAKFIGEYSQAKR